MSKPIEYTIEEKARIGRRLAIILMLKKSRTHKDRYQMTWGNKTALGVFETIRRFGEMIETGEQIIP